MKEGQRKPLIRYSIATILFITLCLCGWLTGYQLGYKAGDERWHYKKTYTVAYNVADLVTPIPSSVSGSGAFADFDSLLAVLQSVVEPDQAGETQIQPFPMNLSLVVTGNGVVHRRIESLLTDLREQQVAPLKNE